MKKNKLIKIPDLVLRPTKKEQLGVYSFFGPPLPHRDKFRLYVKGKMEDSPYCYNANKSLITSPNCHRDPILNELTDIACADFPDKLKMEICLYNVDLFNRQLSSIKITRKQNTLTFKLTLYLGEDAKRTIIWNPNFYVFELEKQFRKMGYKAQKAEEENVDGSAITAIYINEIVEGTIGEKLNNCFAILQKAISNTNEALILKARKTTKIIPL